MIRRIESTPAVCIAMAMILCAIPFSLWAQRYCCEGQSWLKWSQSRREAYIRAYIDGYYDGYLGGCQEGTKGSRPNEPGVENFPVNKCIDREADFKKGIDLSNDVTTFYKRYPENQNLLVREVLEELGKGRTIEDIHQHPPFPAHDFSRANGATEKAK